MSSNSSATRGKIHPNIPLTSSPINESRDSTAFTKKKAAMSILGKLKFPSTTGSDLDAAVAAAQEQALGLTKTLTASVLGQAVGTLQATFQRRMGYIAVEGCTPKNGEELRHMIEHTNCPRLTLVPATNYSITEQLIIRRRVTIVGRPLGLPIIDAHNTTRAFLVEAGGFLDVRFVQIVKGKFVEVVPRFLLELRGPTCYIRGGGVALFTGCRFTTDWMNFVHSYGLSTPETTLRIYGGGIVLESGTLRVTDCHRVIFGIGVVFREIQYVGGEFLVLSGSLYLTGSIFISIFTFANNFGAGGYIANLGGLVVVTGCLFNYVGAFISTCGLGFRSFLGGGASIITGSVFTASTGFSAYFGAGGDFFTGTGVSIFTGLILSSEDSMTTVAGIGLHAALGSGVSIRTGFIMSSMSAFAFSAGCGMGNYVGAGVAIFTDISLARSTALYSFYGLGSRLYLGAGTTTITNVIGFFNTGIGSLAYLGGDTTVLAGYVVRVDQFYCSVTAISFAVGQGADLFLGLGGATLVMHLYISPKPPVFYRSPGLVTLYVAGSNVLLSTALGNSTTLYGVLTANKHGQTDWQKNMFVARTISWRSTDIGPFPGDFTEGRRLQRVPELHTISGPTSYQRHDRAAFQEPGTADMSSASAYLPHYHDVYNLGLESNFDIRPILLEFLNTYLPLKRLARRDLVEAEKERAHFGKSRNKSKSSSMRTTPIVESINGNVTRGEMPKLAQNASYSSHFGSPLYAVPNISSLNIKHTKTDKIYVASPLDVCGVCDVSPGETIDNVDGPEALSKCEIHNTCSNPSPAILSLRRHSEDTDDGPTRASETPPSRMWMTGRNDDPANTTVQVLELRTVLTPPEKEFLFPCTASDSSPYVTKKEVHAAVRWATADLGISERYHLRVNVPFQEDRSYYQSLRWTDSKDVGPPRHETSEAFYLRSIDDKEAAQLRGCQLEMIFEAYLVSDWRNVTNEIARKLRTLLGSTKLTSALQKEVARSAAYTATANMTSADNSSNHHVQSQICDVVVYRTWSIDVPSTTLAGIKSETASLLETAPTSRRTLAAAPDIYPRPSTDHLRYKQKFSEKEEYDDQLRALLDREASASLVLPVPSDTEPYALLRQLPPRVEKIHVNETYSLLLSNFPRTLTRATLTVRAVPREGDEALIASFLSTPHLVTRQQVWNWTVGNSVQANFWVKGMEYYLEVTSSDGVAFDSTNKFQVIQK